MKEAIGAAAALLGLACALASAAPASAKADDDTPIVGIVDKARLVRIPDGTDTLIIGNSTIADVTLLKQKGLMVLTPKAFGETNFIALDATGRPLAESTIRVINSSEPLVVQRGMSRQSYSCAPNCQPIERLGDDGTYMSQVASQADSHTRHLADAPLPKESGAPSTH